MVALPAVSKVIRVALSGVATNGETIANRIFLQYSGTLSSADLTTVVNTIDTAWNTNIAPLVSSDFTLQQIVATDLSSNTAPQVVKTVSHAGTNASAPLAAGTAAVIKFKIARRYRGGHPRFYLGPLGSGILANASQILAATQTSLATGFGNFISACIAAPPAAVGTLNHVSVHYFSGFVNHTFPSGRVRAIPLPLGSPSVDLITAYQCNPNVGSQRRRNRQSV